MSRQLTPPPTGHYPLHRRIADAAWTRRRQPAYPVIVETVTGTATQINHLIKNPNTLQHDNLRLLSDTDMRWSVRVRRIDRAHPTPTPARRRLHALKPAARATALTLIAIAALYGTGALIWHLWGHEITAAVRLILIGAGTVVAALALLTVGSWWTRHGRNGCPGLHCTGCKGGH